MNDIILNKVITITAVEDKGKALKLKDQDGKTFNVWKQKQDGNATVAYSALYNMPGWGMGQTAEVSYKESPYTLPDGKEVMTKTVLAVKKPSQAPTVQNTPPMPTNTNYAPKTPYKAPVTTSNASTPDWDAISRGKVRHGVAIAFIEKSSLLTQENVNLIDAWTDYIMTGKFGTPKSMFEPPMPEEPDMSEIRVEDIPF